MMSATSDDDLTQAADHSLGWALGLAYRRPARLRQLLQSRSGAARTLAATSLLLVSMPLFAALAGLIFQFLFVRESSSSTSLLLIFAILFSPAVGLAVGKAFGRGPAIRFETVVGGLLELVLGCMACIIASVAASYATLDARGSFTEVFRTAVIGGCVLGPGIQLLLRCPKSVTGTLGISVYFVLALPIFWAVSWALGTRSEVAVAVAILLSAFSGVGSGMVCGFFINRPLNLIEMAGVASIAGLTAGLLGGAAAGMVAAAIAAFCGIRAYYVLLHPFFVWPQPRGNAYRRHPAAWDDLCSLPFPRLERLLLCYATVDPQMAGAEIERLIAAEGPHKEAALRTRIALLLGAAAHIGRLAELQQLAWDLPDANSVKSVDLVPLKDALEKMLSNNARRDHVALLPFLQHEITDLLKQRIETVRQWSLRTPAVIAQAARVAADRWLELAEGITQRRDDGAPAIFEAGRPVDYRNEAFVLRQGVIRDLEREINSPTGSPGVILYGRRRMGKSTILKNLGAFLPATIHVCTLSMQNPQAFRSTESFVCYLGQSLRNALLDFELPETTGDLGSLFLLLETCQRELTASGRRLVIALDEYENIDVKIGQKAIAEDLLATIRDSIQAHSRITWLFAGSHEITELSAVPWTSYLVSAHTIEVPPFSIEETYRLLTDPLSESPKNADDTDFRPRIKPEFWGEGGIERIHSEAGGWPHLVQLIAETLVDLASDKDARSIDRQMVEEGLDKAVVTGQNVLHQLIRAECVSEGEWEYLLAFKKRDRLAPPEDETVNASLRRRQLVVAENAEWRLGARLMQRWLVKRS